MWPARRIDTRTTRPLVALSTAQRDARYTLLQCEHESGIVLLHRHRRTRRVVLRSPWSSLLLRSSSRTSKDGPAKELCACPWPGLLLRAVRPPGPVCPASVSFPSDDTPLFNELWRQRLLGLALVLQPHTRLLGFCTTLTADAGPPDKPSRLRDSRRGSRQGQTATSGREISTPGTTRGRCMRARRSYKAHVGTAAEGRSGQPVLENLYIALPLPIRLQRASSPCT